MKICFIFSNFHLSHITGQSGLIVRLINEVKKFSFRVSVISNDLKNRQFKKEEVDYYLFKGLGDFKSYFLNFILVANFIRKIKPDVIHVNGILMTIYICTINKLFKIRIVSLITESIDNINPFYRKLFVICTKQCSQIFVTCEFLKKQLSEIGVPKNRITIVHIGLDKKYLQEFYSVNQPIDILYFGDSNLNRGFDIIFNLAKKLSHRNFWILIRFEDKECANYLKSIKKLNNVNILNYPYFESLEKIILKTKLVVLPYRWMLLRPPLSLLESMALGKCIITSNMPGNEEVVRDRYNAVIANFNYINKVIEKIEYLINNKKVRIRLGRSARKTVSDMYSLKEYAKIIDWYALKKT